MSKIIESKKILNNLYRVERTENITEITRFISNGVNWKSFRCRFLTPKEQFRLSGFSDEDYEKASKVNCKTRLWAQTGNTIVVGVVEELLRMMFDEYGNFFV